MRIHKATPQRGQCIKTMEKEKKVWHHIQVSEEAHATLKSMASQEQTSIKIVVDKILIAQSLINKNK